MIQPALVSSSLITLAAMLGTAMSQQATLVIMDSGTNSPMATGTEISPAGYAAVDQMLADYGHQGIINSYEGWREDGGRLGTMDNNHNDNRLKAAIGGDNGDTIIIEMKDNPTLGQQRARLIH